MKLKPDGVGRTILIALVAGALFAGFLALTPRLTAGSQAPESDAASEGSTTTVAATKDPISEPVVAIPAAELLDGLDEEPPTEGDTDASISTTTTTTSTTTMANGPEPDGSLTLTVELIGPREGKEQVILRDEDEVEWHFLVENSSSEELWGVYLYFETHGPVWCDATYLEPGDTTDCFASREVWAGQNTAEFWATAWTTEREVAARLMYEYMVGG